MLLSIGELGYFEATERVGGEAHSRLLFLHGPEVWRRLEGASRHGVAALTGLGARRTRRRLQDLHRLRVLPMELGIVLVNHKVVDITMYLLAENGESLLFELCLEDLLLLVPVVVGGFLASEFIHLFELLDSI